ncbi:MAG TPA: oligosaccharide repeat unit polymerase family protein [Methanobacterium sp.]
MNLKKIDIFSPLILIIIILLYLLLAVIGIGYGMRGLYPVSFTTYVYIFYGISIFFLGFLFARYIERHFFRKIKVSEDLKTFFDYISNSRYFNERTVLLFVIFPLLLELINLYFLGGIPLFSGFLKAKAFNTLTVISYILFLISINVLVAKFYKKKYFLLVFIGLILFSATGYRAISLAIILSVLITIYYINGYKFKLFLILMAITVILGLLVGYIAAISIEWQHWDVNPLSLVFIRAGFTLDILDKIISLENSGQGLLTYHILTGFISSVDPRLILGQMVLKSNVSYTSTIFGPAILEFGYVGLTVQMFFIGVILELLHHLQKIKKGLYTAFYAIGLAHTIIWVETSPTDLAVWIYYLIAVILLIYAGLTLNKDYKNKNKK